MFEKGQFMRLADVGVADITAAATVTPTERSERRDFPRYESMSHAVRPRDHHDVRHVHDSTISGDLSATLAALAPVEMTLVLL